MTVVTSLDEISMCTTDLVEVVNSGERLGFDDAGYGRGVRERFTVQRFKPRDSRLARFELLATVMVAVCLYALTFVALLHVVRVGG